MAYVLPDKDTFQHKLFWAAVLRRAVFDYVLYKGVGSKRREWQYAHRYVFSKGARYNEGLAFEEVCDLFDWDPDYLRRLTLQMTRADIKKLEFNSMKEEVTLQDKMSMAVERFGRWTSNRFAVPQFPPYNFPPELRKDFESVAIYHRYQHHPKAFPHWGAEATA
jgi:hypothetical protein